MSTSTPTTSVTNEDESVEQTETSARLRGRPKGSSSVKQNFEIKAALKMAKLEGESDGRTLGRIEERRQIVEWLRSQKGTWRSPYDLAQQIESGDHKRWIERQQNTDNG
jgi:hypothetical protein